MNQENDDNNVVEFTQTIEFYWRSIAVYSIILFVYMLVFGTISKGTFAINAFNPVVILMMMIIVGTAISMLYRISRKRAIIIGRDYIIFKSRFKEKKYYLKDIINIYFTKEKIFKGARKLNIVKIKIKQRKLMVKIRPSTFDDDLLLLKMLKDFAIKLQNLKN